MVNFNMIWMIVGQKRKKIEQKEQREKLELHVDELFKELDTEKTGKVSFQSYLNMVKRLGGYTPLFLFQEPKKKK